MIWTEERDHLAQRDRVGAWIVGGPMEARGRLGPPNGNVEYFDICHLWKLESTRVKCAST
jgi:hypothetical protein